MTTERRSWTKLIASLLFGVVAIGGLALLQGAPGEQADSRDEADTRSVPDGRSPEVTMGTRETVDRIDAAKSGPATPSPNPPPAPATLPDFAVPLAEQLPMLVEQSRRGDPRAACRLVASINRCTTAAQRRAFADRVRESLEKGAGKNDGLMIDLLARSEEQGSSEGAFCDGVDPTALPRTEFALEHALAALTPQQKTIIAMLRSDGQLRRLVRTQATSEPSAYVVPDIVSSNQKAFLLAGFDAKDPLALEGLIIMHSPSSAIMSQGVWGMEPNVRLFLRYALLMARLYGPASLGEQAGRAVAAASSVLPDGELKALGREAEAEAQRWALAHGRSALLPGEALPPVSAAIEPLRACGE